MREDSQEDCSTLCVEPNGRFLTTPARGLPPVADSHHQSTLANRKETVPLHHQAAAHGFTQHLDDYVLHDDCAACTVSHTTKGETPPALRCSPQEDPYG
jgi:hypothetical protein